MLSNDSIEMFKWRSRIVMEWPANLNGLGYIGSVTIESDNMIYMMASVNRDYYSHPIVGVRCAVFMHCYAMLPDFLRKPESRS